ncbi:MAG: ArsR/SmtB family transcription factor [Planctomycetota bacterium]|jgi:ArsR family transcriptional regulator
MAGRSSSLMFRAFADETRLRILHLLCGGELCVGDLVEILGVAQPTASRHLAYLRRAGLVAARRQGLWHHYRLTAPADPLHRRLVECVESCFEDVALMRADRVRADRVWKSGGCCPR